MTGPPATPVLPGFFPDPSVCRVGDTFYLVNSSFEYWPGLPLHRSRDPVHWEPLGHAVDRAGGASQAARLGLRGVAGSGGLFAATIRHHAGRFFIVGTVLSRSGRMRSFVLTAVDPAGRWSDPVFPDGAEGFDPSLCFDEHGRGWWTATRPRGEGAAPGRTERHHSVVVARADAITGPYRGSPDNPAMTHRHLGRRAEVQAVGHADLVTAVDGSWWALLHGVRPLEGHHTMGRETFLAPVGWEDGWPVFNPGHGRLTAVAAAGRRAAPPFPTHDFAADPGVADTLLSVRGPERSARQVPGGLRMTPAPGRPGPTAFLGVRQQHRRFVARCRLTPAAGSAAGLLLRQSEAAWIAVGPFARWRGEGPGGVTLRWFDCRPSSP